MNVVLYNPELHKLPQFLAKSESYLKIISELQGRQYLKHKK
jgi:hypothetical protein